MVSQMPSAACHNVTMFSHLPLQEKAKYLAAFLLAGAICAWIGFSRQEPAPIAFDDLGPIPQAPIEAKPVLASTVEKPKASQRAKKQLPAEASILLNSATSADLQKLPGVGPATAAKILAYRQRKGRFKRIDQLLAVKGIGPKKLKAMRKYLKL